MANLATINTNILADSGIDDLNVIVSTGSYNNPAWITALAWTKITGAPTIVGSVTASSPLFSSGGTSPNITIQQASGSQSGFLSSTDWTTFNNKQNALTNPVTGTGASGQVAYFNGTTTITSESNLFWDATNDRLGIGTSSPTDRLTLHRDGATAVYAHWRNNSNANNAYIGITGDGLMQIQNNGNIDFYTGASYNNQMTLAGTGNLIIGNPGSDNGARLQVSGRINATGGGSNGVLVSSNSGSVTIPTTGLSLNTGFNVGYLQNFNGGNYVDLYYGASKHIFDGGNVGIGTASPTFRFDVETSNLTVGRFWSNASGKRNNILIQNSANWNYGVMGVVSATGSSNGDVYGLGYSASGSTAFTEVLNWTSTGNVGINSSSGFNQISSVETTLKIANTNAASLYLEVTGVRGYANFVGPGGNMVWYDYTAGADRMILFTNGNLRVGTGSDNGARLQVSGSGRFIFRNNSNEITDLLLSTEAANATSKLSFLWYGNETAALKFNRGSDSTGSSLGLWTQPELGSTTERMRITSSGNVGIGTSSPGGRLEVRDGTGVNLRVRNNGSNNLLIQNYNDSDYYRNMQLAASTIQFLTGTEGGLSASEQMRITSSGNVLIGTTTDVGARLYVDGAFRTGTLTAGTQTAAVDWRLGNARGGTATANALVRVQINGVLVDLIGNYV